MKTQVVIFYFTQVKAGQQIIIHYYSVQLLSHVGLFVTPWTTARQASMSITNSRSLLKFMSMELVMPSNHLILCCPLLLPPSIVPSIRVFSNQSVLPIRWPKHWSFSFSISPSSEYSGLISFKMDWFDQVVNIVHLLGVLVLQKRPSPKTIQVFLNCSSLFSASTPFSD